MLEHGSANAAVLRRFSRPALKNRKALRVSEDWRTIANGLRLSAREQDRMAEVFRLAED